MRLLKRLAGLTGAERRLVAQAVLALGVAALAIALFPFRRVARIAARRIEEGAARETERRRQIAEVRWAVSACARRVPWRAKCFEQGLAAQWLLARRQVATTLYYGVAKEEHGGLIGHVWVRAGAIDVIGCEISQDFAELARFPAAPDS